MNAFDWYNVLTPWALIVLTVNLLAGFCLKPEYRHGKVRIFSIIGYIGMLIGWCIMRFALQLKFDLFLLTDVAMIGWLLLLPSVLLVAGCFLQRLKHEREHFTKTGNKVSEAFGMLIKIIGKIFIGVVTLGAAFVAMRSRPEEEPINTENDTVAGLYRKPPKNTFGGRKYF